MQLRELDDGDASALADFLRRIPEGDRTFFKEAVEDPAVIRAWVDQHRGRWVAVEPAGDILGYVAVVPLHGWSSHVGEIRLIVDPARRGEGVGTTLARRATIEAFRSGLTKLVVEVLAAQEFTIEMFRALGFDPEALLVGQVMTRQGEFVDLMILAHHGMDATATAAAAGLASGV